MKRAAAFTTLAFFVFLNSGMFVCAVHCSIAQIVAKPTMQMACNHYCCKKSCGPTKSTDCPKKHGNYSIKENIQPGYSIRLHMPLLTLNYAPQFLPYSAEVARLYAVSAIQKGKAPPGSGKSIPIKFHSLLI